MGSPVIGFDPLVVGATHHVVWQDLTPAAQVDLLTNFPLNPPATVPGPTVFLDDVDPRFQSWLDMAYTQRHAFDNIADDATF